MNRLLPFLLLLFLCGFTTVRSPRAMSMVIPVEPPHVILEVSGNFERPNEATVIWTTTNQPSRDPSIWHVYTITTNDLDTETVYTTNQYRYFRAENILQ
jgi:hypothetical protein